MGNFAMYSTSMIPYLDTASNRYELTITKSENVHMDIGHTFIFANGSEKTSVC